MPWSLSFRSVTGLVPCDCAGVRVAGPAESALV